MLSRSMKSKVFDFEDYVNRHDYVGALTILEQAQNDALSSLNRLLWIAYCSMRLGNYERAKSVYEEILLLGQKEDAPSDLGLYLAIANYYLGSYGKAEKSAMSVVNDSELKNRILVHIARATDDETKIATYRQQLSDSKEDELAAAAIELYRCRYKEASDVYEKMLTDSEEDLALNVFLAICYYKMDCFDLSLEALEFYSRAFPDSTLAANIKACNVFRLFEDGNAALEVIDELCENVLIAHNRVVFQDGQTALKVWPGLVGKIPEARLNLAIYFLRQGETEAAAELMDGVEASCPQSHALLGLLNAETSRSPESLEKAQSHFQSVGSNPSECDTILGRQCMASSLILQKKHEEALVYLESIKSYLETDDVFNWNYGLALAAVGRYDEALEALQLISEESIKKELAYTIWVAKCFIKVGALDKAWGCLDTDQEITYEVLQLIANECYRFGGQNFLYATRAFRELFEIDRFPDYLNGLIGASVGFFRHCIAQGSGFGEMTEVVCLLQSTASPKARAAAKTIEQWIVRYT